MKLRHTLKKQLLHFRKSGKDIHFLILILFYINWQICCWDLLKPPQWILFLKNELPVRENLRRTRSRSSASMLYWKFSDEVCFNSAEASFFPCRGWSSARPPMSREQVATFQLALLYKNGCLTCTDIICRFTGNVGCVVVEILLRIPSVILSTRWSDKLNSKK